MVKTAVTGRGGEADAANHLFRWVSEHPLFTDVVYRSFLFPTSPWIPSDYPNAARMNRAGSLMREDIQVPPFFFCNAFTSSDAVHGRHFCVEPGPCSLVAEWTKLSLMNSNKKSTKNSEPRSFRPSFTSRTSMHAVDLELIGFGFLDSPFLSFGTVLLGGLPP
jgi:hypothetical protein